MLKFVYYEKEYVLEKDKNVCFLNDEEKPVEGISLDDILNMIDNLEEIDFDTQYYKEACVEDVYKRQPHTTIIYIQLRISYWWRDGNVKKR